MAVAAKHPMTSVAEYFFIETLFTVVQFALVAPLMALAWRSQNRTDSRKEPPLRLSPQVELAAFVEAEK